MPSWTAEADWPVAWTNIYFSPIVLSGSDHIVYVGGRDLTNFYKYNISTDTWTAITASPGAILGAISMSPDGTKLAAHAGNGNVLFIYNIAGDSWTSSSGAPTIGGSTSMIQRIVWADNDTIWCLARSGVGPLTAKCLKYVVSTDTWTQYTNSMTTSYGNADGMGISPDGATLYFNKCGSTAWGISKYVISTDTYTVDTISLGSGYYPTLTSDRNRLWYGLEASSKPQITSYIDLSDESLVTDVFPTYADRTVVSNLSAGVYGTTIAIVWYRTTETKNWSYFTESPFTPRIFII